MSAASAHARARACARRGGVGRCTSAWLSFARAAATRGVVTTMRNLQKTATSPC